MALAVPTILAGLTVLDLEDIRLDFISFYFV
jgi:hypothetical protein